MQRPTTIDSLLSLQSPVFEWVDYSAPLVCLEEEEDGACLREEQAPCSEDPSALVCSIDTRQLPQKRWGETLAFSPLGQNPMSKTRLPRN